MRTPLPLAVLLVLSIAANSQTHLSPQRSIYRSQKAFIDCAEALPRLYDQHDFDSIAYYIRLRIRTSPGFQPDLYVLRILFDIQQHRFSPDSLKDPYLYYALDEYVQDLMASQSEDGYWGIYATQDFDPRPSYQQEFALLAHWAEDLVEIRRLSNAEQFLCQTIAGDFEHPRKTARGDKVRYWQMNTLLDASMAQHRRESTLNFYFGGGVWIPRGKLAMLGVHPSITAIGIGKKNWTSEWDFVLALRFLPSAQPYTVLRGDSLYSSINFFGGYLGLDYTRYLIHVKRLEAGLIAGIGFEGFDVNDDYSDSHPVGPPPPGSINSLNLNLGTRINYYINPKHYIGVAGRYNFVGYSNPGGTPLTGNAFTIDLIVGFN